MSGAEMSGDEMAGAQHARIRSPRAEHVGSLLRPKALLAAMDEIYLPGHTALLAEERGKDLTAMRAAEDAAIDVALVRQRDAGLDVLSDGEFRRMLFTNSFYDAVDGLRPNEQGVPFVNSAGESQEYAGPPIFDRRLTKVDSPPAKEAAYLAAHTDAPFKVTFPAASWFCEPQVISPGRPVPGYDSAEEARAHCLEILRELVLETIAQGTRYIQFDFPAYPLLADEVWSGRLKGMGVDLDEMLALSLEADRQILDGLPTDVHYGMHICRGNWRSRWMFTGSLEPFAEAVFALPTTRSSSSGRTPPARATTRRCGTCRRARSSPWASCPASRTRWRPRTTCCGGWTRRRSTSTSASSPSRRSAASAPPPRATSSTTRPSGASWS
jgi:5-methyltetrahydropteroyltriglutamate--homocysteine methyltransferase